jgi:uncharacterized protein
MAFKHNLSQLFEAVMSKNIAEIDRVLQEDVAINDQDENGFTALMLAATRGDAQSFAYLLKRQADVNLRNDIGQNALMIAGKTGYIPIVEAVIASGAAVSDLDNEGRSAIDWTITGGDFREIISLLISRGADVNSLDSNGFTPLMRAAILGRLESATRLLKAGANKDMILHGKTAAEMAEDRGFNQLSEQIKAFRND